MDVEEHRDLRMLEAVHQDSRVTQRGLASQLGIALGLANIYLKRMIHKGFIKCVNVQPNRIAYLVTPRGIAEKARLTYEFMDYSLHLYGEVRQHLRTVLRDCAAAGQRVAICGRGEAAELAYLSLKESGLEPVAIFDKDGGAQFLGHAGAAASPNTPRSNTTWSSSPRSNDRGSGWPICSSVGVPREKLFPLRKEPAARRASPHRFARPGNGKSRLRNTSSWH